MRGGRPPLWGMGDPSDGGGGWETTVWKMGGGRHPYEAWGGWETPYGGWGGGRPPLWKMRGGSPPMRDRGWETPLCGVRGGWKTSLRKMGGVGAPLWGMGGGRPPCGGWGVGDPSVGCEGGLLQCWEIPQCLCTHLGSPPPNPYGGPTVLSLRQWGTLKLFGCPTRTLQVLEDPKETLWGRSGP